jgi:hypothetical protein
VIVDSFKFLPRTFRPFYEARGPFAGEEEPVWARFEKRLAESRIALLTSAGMYVKNSQPSFDLNGATPHGVPSLPPRVPPRSASPTHI